MTGYGKAEAALECGKILVEIRSVNGKNGDISIKSSLLPKDKEMEVRSKIASSLIRGNIDLFFTFEANGAEGVRRINRDVVMEYYKEIMEIGNSIGMEGLLKENPNLLIQNLLRMPDVIDTKKGEVITPENWPIVEKAIDEAIEAITAFRRIEGESLHRDVEAKVHNILSYVDELEKYEQERVASIRERILTRLHELSVEVDQNRFEHEMIYYIEKLDINEEKVRLRHHCNYFLETLEREPYPGKKLGFIAQEMGREINTTGSKSNHTQMQQIVVKMKDELEKIKEQSLNIL